MKALRKPLSLFMAMLMCLGIFAGTGTTAFAAGGNHDDVYGRVPPCQRPQQGRLGDILL